MKIWTLGMASALVLLGGCATQDRVTLVTSTGLNLGADAAKGSVNLGYERTEWIVGPTYVNDGGGVAPMVAAVGQSGPIWEPEVGQIVALGGAAMIVTGSKPTGSADTQPSGPCGEGKSCQGDTRLQFFGTRTSLGFNMSFKTASAAAIILGYDRTEFANFPLANCREDHGRRGDEEGCKASFPSALASFYFKGGGGTADGGVSTHTALGQFFATGVPAENLAGNADVQAAFIGAIAKISSPQSGEGGRKPASTDSPSGPADDLGGAIGKGLAPQRAPTGQ